MPAALVWIQRPHIVCLEYSGEVTAEDILQVSDEALKIVERRPTYFLMSVAEVRSYPPNLVNLIYSHSSTVHLIQHPNYRATALINASHAFRLALEIVMRNRTFAAFEDREAALEFLRRCLREDQADLIVYRKRWKFK